MEAHTGPVLGLDMHSLQCMVIKSLRVGARQAWV